jgi:hypothetical protein
MRWQIIRGVGRDKGMRRAAYCALSQSEWVLASAVITPASQLLLAWHVKSCNVM